MNSSYPEPLPPLTWKEFAQRLGIVFGMLGTFTTLAFLVIWLATPAVAGS